MGSTIDTNGAMHDNLGRYAEQNKSAAGYDLTGPGTGTGEASKFIETSDGRSFGPFADTAEVERFVLDNHIALDIDEFNIMDGPASPDASTSGQPTDEPAALRLARRQQIIDDVQFAGPGYTPNRNIGPWPKGINGNFPKRDCPKQADRLAQDFGFQGGAFDYDRAWFNEPASFSFTTAPNADSAARPTDRQPATVRGKTTGEAQAFASAFALGSMLSDRPKTNPYRDVMVSEIRGRGTKAELAEALDDARRNGIDVVFDDRSVIIHSMDGQARFRLSAEADLTTRQKTQLARYAAMGANYEIES